jgi:hypothetical protein
MAYKFQLGTTYLEGATTYEDALTAEGALSGAAGSFDAITATALNIQDGGITNAGAIAGASTLVMGGALSGVTTIAASGLASLGTLVVDDAGTIGTDSDTDMLTLTNAQSVLIASDIELRFRDSGLAIATTADGVLDISADGLINMSGSIRTTGALTAGGAFAGTTVSGSGQLSGKNLVIDDGLTIGVASDTDMLTLTNAQSVLVASDIELRFRDSGLNIASTANAVLDISSDGLINMSGSVRTNGTVNAGGAFTGTTLSGSGVISGFDLVLQAGRNIGVNGDTDLLELEANTLNVNGALVVSSVSAAIVDPAGSKPFLIWNDTNNAFDYVSWSTFVTGVAGTGLTADASTGKISVSSAGTVTAIGDLNVGLSEGLNYASASLTAARVFTLPAASTLSDGDVVRVKMAAGVTTTNTATITCSVGAIDNIDGENSIVLESIYAAVDLYKVADNTFRIL